MRTSRTWLALGVGILLICGCASRFTRANFDRLTPGRHDRTQVAKILGEPSHRIGDSWLYESFDSSRAAQLIFDEEGRLLDKEWTSSSDGVAGSTSMP